jgi:hypothetical protein
MANYSGNPHQTFSRFSSRVMGKPLRNSGQTLTNDKRNLLWNSRAEDMLWAELSGVEVSQLSGRHKVAGKTAGYLFRVAR